MKVKRKILIIISMMMLLFVGCSDTNNTQNTKGESIKDENEVSLDDIEHDVPYVNLNTGEIDVEVINDRYKNVNKYELSYDTIQDDIESLIEEHNANPDNMSKIHIPEQTDASYKSILEGYSYESEGNVFNFTYDEAMELAKQVLPDDVEEVDYILNEEFNIEYIYYTSSKGNFRVNLRYIDDFNDKDIEEIHKGSIIAISYSKEF